MRSCHLGGFDDGEEAQALCTKEVKEVEDKGETYQRQGFSRRRAKKS
jgi:hypothetical protein